MDGPNHPRVSRGAGGPVDEIAGIQRAASQGHRATVNEQIACLNRPGGVIHGNSIGSWHVIGCGSQAESRCIVALEATIPTYRIWVREPAQWRGRRVGRRPSSIRCIPSARRGAGGRTAVPIGDGIGTCSQATESKPEQEMNRYFIQESHGIMDEGLVSI